MQGLVVGKKNSKPAKLIGSGMWYTITLSHTCVLPKLLVNTATFTEREFCIEHKTYLQLKPNSFQQLSHPRFRHILGKGEGNLDYYRG